MNDKAWNIIEVQPRVFVLSF